MTLVLRPLAWIGAAGILGLMVVTTVAVFWRYALNKFEASPVFGVGWLSYSGRAMNVENAYVHALASGGLVGSALFLGVVISTGLTALHRNSALRRSGLPGRTELLLIASIFLGLLLHGLGESALLLGTTPNAALFGLCVGVLARIHELARHSVTSA